MRDHAQMDMPPPILARNILMKAMGCFIPTSGEVLFRFVEPISRSGSKECHAKDKTKVAGSYPGSYHGAQQTPKDLALLNIFAEFEAKGPILSTKHERVPAHPNLLGGEGTAARDTTCHVSIDLLGVVPINSDVPPAYLNSNKSLLKGDA